MTGTYSDGSTTSITNYTLSGELVAGSNTITVTYEDKTATFTVTVTAVPGGGGTGGGFINSGGGTGDANTGDELMEIEDEETALSVMPVQDNPFIDILTDA